MNYSNDLCHWGIKGQKWGERRYQNEDGTYTEEGKERRRKDTARYAASKTAFDRGRDLTGTLRNIVNKQKNKRAYEDIDLTKKTDQELREYINRYNLEQQYKNIVNPTYTAKGKEVTLQILDTVGDVLSVAGSAAALYLSIRAIKGAGV